MTIVTTRNLKFNDRELFNGSKKTGYAVTQDEVYQQMWRVVYPDGKLSEDMYNKDRAKEHCYRLALNITESTFDTEKKGARPKLEGAGEPQRSPLVRLNEVPGTTLPSRKNNERTGLLENGSKIVDPA